MTDFVAGAALLRTYESRIQDRLKHPNGPPLRVFTNGAAPIRALVAIYSMILNGYGPWHVSIYGEDQWGGALGDLFAETAPFARIVSAEKVLDDVRQAGGERLVVMAKAHWFVMKAFVALLAPAGAWCMMDDDVVVLDGVDDALSALQFANLVFSPDLDQSNAYHKAWPWIRMVPQLPRTGSFGSALFWFQSLADPGAIADYSLRSNPATTAPGLWEQGLIASLYAYRNTRLLSPQRYLNPRFTVSSWCPADHHVRRQPVYGLPDGVLGYDYAANPCGFASIHLGAVGEYFSDEVALRLAPQILGRCEIVNPPLGLGEVVADLPADGEAAHSRD